MGRTGVDVVGARGDSSARRVPWEGWFGRALGRVPVSGRCEPAATGQRLVRRTWEGFSGWMAKGWPASGETWEAAM